MERCRAGAALLEHADGLALNYYGPSTISVTRPSGTRVTITQFGDYPIKPEVEIVVECAKLEEFTLRLRIPAWSTNTLITINNEPQETPAPGQYLALKRTWASKTRLCLTFDFTLRINLHTDVCRTAR